MYKKRFAAWGLAKNRRKVRASAGSAGTGGRPVVLDLCAWEAQHMLDEHLIGREPGEAALYSISAWANGSFDGTRWMWANHRPRILNPDGPATYPSTQMYQDMALSRALLARRQGCLAGMAVRKAFWQLEDVIRAGDPGMMRNLVDIVLDMMRLRQYQLLRMLLCQLASLAAHRLPALHPLVHYFQQLSRNTDELADVIIRTYRCFVERFHGRMDDSFYWMYDNWVWDSSIRTMDTDPEADYACITGGLRTLSLTLEADEAAVSTRCHLNLLKDTALMKSDGFSKTSAKAVLETVEDATVESEAVEDARVRSYVRTAAVKRAIDREDWTAVKTSMCAHIESQELIHGRDSRQVIRELWSLEKVMRKAGDSEEADLIAKDALGRIHRYLSEVPEYMN